MSALPSTADWLASIRRGPCSSFACSPYGCADCLDEFRSAMARIGVYF